MASGPSNNDVIENESRSFTNAAELAENKFMAVEPSSRRTDNPTSRLPIVIFVKTPMPDCEQDPYTLTFETAGYDTGFLPVLKTIYCNLNELEDILRGGPRERWSGVVITSRRAVDAIQVSLDQSALSLQESSTFACPSSPTNQRRPSNIESWDSIPFFAVGPRTASGLELLRFAGHRFPSDERALRIIGQDQSGTGAKLAKLIIQTLLGSSSSPPFTSITTTVSSQPDDSQIVDSSDLLPILHLVGDHPHPDLSETLQTLVGKRLRIVDHQVYKTEPINETRIEPNFLHSKLLLRGNEVNRPDWLVFFSPNSAKLGLTSLIKNKDVTHLNPSKKTISGFLKSFRIAVIGPTTCDWFYQTYQIYPNAIADRPTPESLLRAIINADNKSG